MAEWQGQRGTRHERGYGYRWTKLRERVLKRDKYLCVPCMRNGRLRDAKAVDHVTPKAEGGTDDMTNLQAICGPCHADKTSREGLRSKGVKPKPCYGVDGWPLPEGGGG